jgi:hypothetical protein
MTRDEFEKMIDDLLDRNIEITMLKVGDQRWYDLNTKMKSHLHIALIGDVCVFDSRYDESGEIDDLDDLRRVGGRCMYGRDYAAEAWIEFMNEEEA